jgi:hypothetical protein
MIARTWVVAVVCCLLLAMPAVPQCVSTEIPVSQPFVFPNHGAGPLAWTGSGYGLAKLDGESFTAAIYFALYDANLNQTSPDVLVTSISFAGPHALVWNGSEFALFYQTQLQQIVFQRIDASGHLIGTPIPVAPQHGNGSNQAYEAAWDPAQQAYAVFHTVTDSFERGLWLTLITPGGVQKSDAVISLFVANPVSPSLAVTPSGLIGVAWSRINNDQQEAAFGIVRNDGTLLTSTSIRVGGLLPRVGTDGRFFYVAYSAPVTGGTVLRAVKYDLAGNVATPDAVIATGLGGDDLAATSVIANPTLNEWAVMYRLFGAGFLNPELAETRIHRVPFSGGVQTDAPLAQDTTKRRFAPRSELTWNGSAYVATVAGDLSRISGIESYFVRQCPLLVSATANPAISLPDAPITFTANPSGGTGPYKFSWSFGDVSSPEPGQTVTHAYRAPGTYNVTVTATDLTGATRTTTITVTVANLKRRPSKHI